MRKPILAVSLALALATGALVAQAQQQQQQADKEAQSFIKTAIQGHHAEIDGGKLAQEKAKSDAVKQFGAMMVKDHSAALEKAKATAKEVGIESPPASADLTQQAVYLKMKLLQGDSFDRSYINDMVQDHEKDVSEYQKAAMRNDPTGAYAKELLPTLQKHLDEAKKVDSQLDQATVGSGASGEKQ